MVCVYCNGKTSVINSRPQRKSGGVWRRRSCENCQAVFTTREEVDAEQSIMVVNSGSLEPFLRDKLFISIHDSLKHRKTSLRDAKELTDTIWKQLVPHFHAGTVEKHSIITVAGATLQRFDPIAATHYLAYHKR